MIRSSAADQALAPPTGPEAAIGADPAAPAAQPEVLRLVRVSRARLRGSAMDELFAARQRVHGEGRVPGLCGAVLHVAGWFVLWQEGPETAIEAALKTASRRRHEVPRILHRSFGPRTLHEPLTLSATQWLEGPVPFERRIDAVAQAAGTMHPQDVWRVLSKPCTLTPPAILPSLDRRFGLLAAHDQRAIERARRIADHFDRPLVYRRFADAAPGTSDFGAAYLDLPLHDRTLRVQAVSRRAFGHPLVHEALRPADRLVLLVGEQARPTLELAAGMAGFLRRMDPRAVIELVAQDAAVGAAVADVLRGQVSAALSLREAALSEAQLVALLLGAAAQVPAA
ncbi:hypothetical protein PE066_15930 [Ramlibacter tataouinensis]|uniref:hypothetical protein n=1 Tax=Ramlibacter tataouinensis TaxID=94132 RepID=UPI0022F3E694|nr:hypothetical protein [Ramlibacter tataouinensis]WBY00940.1 hypothetical protein PE066_15930 [Ramlibacter tataouinensis]